MPRISRIHFAGLGHQDARFPSLTLDLRDAEGRASDSVIWAENGTGKSSLLSLYFSTYRPSQRLFLGKQAESKARELGDYLRDRDLGFVVTEWDTTDDRAEASLLSDGPRELLIVGQSLSWRALDRNTGDLRRLFFTLRAGRDVNFDSLPVLGLGEPVASFEAFRDWLDAQNKAHPRLAIVHTTNQTEWRGHLENNHLDPELFTFQLRMNEREGGINNLFNELKRDADFIHEFLKLGFDPATANEVRANLDAFLPKLRRRDALELQLEFNQKLLVDLGLFVQQLSVWEAAKTRGETAEREAGSLLAALIAAHKKFSDDSEKLDVAMKELESDKTRIESARTTNGRRQNFFKKLKGQLEVAEAEAEFTRCENARTSAQADKRIVEMAIVLGEVRKLMAEAEALSHAISQEEKQAKPVMAALQTLGAAYKFQLTKSIADTAAIQKNVQDQHEALSREINGIVDQRTALATEQSAKQNESDQLTAHFTSREQHRDRLRTEGWLEAKEPATDALTRWQTTVAKAKESEENATRELLGLREEQSALITDALRLSTEIATAKSRATQLEQQVATAESEDERIATHEQMRAAIESSRADLNLPQSVERLSERAASLFRQILRLNVEGAEDERSQVHVDKQRLFPPHHDVETLVEKLRAAGIRSANTAAQWLAYNFTDPKAAADLLASDPARFGGVLFDGVVDGSRLPEVISALRTEQLPVLVTPAPDGVSPTPSASNHGIVVLPRHAGGVNFAVAQAEGEKLTARISDRAKDIETLNGQLNATKTLLDDVRKWLNEFGGAKLGTLREKARGERQSLVSFQERQQQNVTRQEEVKVAITAATTAETESRASARQAEKAIGQLESFIERFDSDYEAKRTLQGELASRLQELCLELPRMSERIGELRQSQAPLLTRVTELGIEIAAWKKESSEITYAGEQPASVADSLDHLRARYKIETQQYEGQFLNTKAQGQLEAKRTAINEKENALEKEFAGVNRTVAEQKLLLGDLAGQLSQATTDFSAAQEQLGSARHARTDAQRRLTALGTTGEQERPGQVDLIPATSAEAAAEVAKLESEYNELQGQIDANRTATQSSSATKSALMQRATEYDFHIRRLRDQTAPEGISAAELPDDDAKVKSQAEEKLQRLKRTRIEIGSEREKLRMIHSRILDLSQEERFARAMDLPARSLFTHMPLEELILTAVEKEKAVKEETLVLQADLEQMNQHRETLVESLLNVCEQAARLLHRAEKWSVLPADMGEWSREPFLRIRLRLSQNRADNLARLKSLVDLLFSENKIPPAVDLVFRGLTALVGETGVDATILKPETQRRRQRYAVREMGSWSEGERTTVAILLYCTLVRIRAQSRGHAGRRTEVSALLLDNPVGPCSKPEFLQMHRWIASQLGVQLIYATGINDPAALSVFPNRIRLAKNRFIPATGELAVGLQTDPEASVIHDIRIFDGNGEEDRNSPLPTEE
jgi:chromosome segregation ATPase